MRQYLDAVREILRVGTRKENRTGIDTLSTFDISYKIDLREGFPLLTTKKINWKNIIVENLWFLSGEPHIGILQKHNCKFWDAWADDEGFVPSAYGNIWRRFPVPVPDAAGRAGAYNLYENDQIAWIVDQLRNNPMSRRMVVSAWAPGNAQTSKLPPCHCLFILNVQHLPEKCAKCKGTGTFWHAEDDSICDECKGKGVFTDKTKPHLCLHLTQRSCDIGLGVPYNIAGYAFLLEMFARFADIPAGIFGHTLVDAHSYTCKPDGSKAEYDHVPGLKEQLTREPRQLPRLKIDPSIKDLDDINKLITADTNEVMSKFVLEGYDPWPAIRFKVAV